jgi:hypothetical protein
MSSNHYYWITSEKNPEGYPHEKPVIERLRERGHIVTPFVWDRGTLPSPLSRNAWVVVRTPWDYLGKYTQFIAWIDSLPRDGVFNPGSILKWNSDKRYLGELQALGIPIAPTHWFLAQNEADFDREVLGAFPGRKIVIKPAISAGASDTFRLSPGELPPRETLLNRRLMLQPYLEEVEIEGEKSFVFFSGKFSHALRKLPREGDYRVQEGFGGRFLAFHPSPIELEFAERVLRALSMRFPKEKPPLYARVDALRTESGLVLMELELLEPDLYFHHAPGAAERFVTALEGASSRVAL